MLLHMEEVDVRYGGIQALREVSLSIGQGEILTVLGANGAGKTTLVNAVCGFEPPTTGRVWFQGDEITGLAPHAIVRLGIVQVPEGRGIFGTLSVLENLRVGAYLLKDTQRVQRTLAEVYEIFPVLRDRRRQSAGSLSGGEQQMLAIGRALMAGPKLLLMDEPTLGLSPMMRKEVERVTRRINEAGTSIMLVEQNARMALRVAHKGVVLQNGQIVLRGTSSDLLNDPSLRESYLS